MCSWGIGNVLYAVYKSFTGDLGRLILQYLQNFIIQSHEFRQMGRSCICIDFYAMKQMWIDKCKINTLETFIRQSLSNLIENTSIIRHFL